MTKERKRYLDDLWMNTDVGKWASAIADGRRNEANKICDGLFQSGYVIPVEHLLDEEKKVGIAVKRELKYKGEGREYMDSLEENNYNLVDIMVAYEFSLLDLYDL